MKVNELVDIILYQKVQPLHLQVFIINRHVVFINDGRQIIHHEHQ